VESVKSVDVLSDAGPSATSTSSAVLLAGTTQSAESVESVDETRGFTSAESVDDRSRP
jgi:hypothetical protein